MKKRPRYLKQSKYRKRVSVVKVQLCIILILLVVLSCMIVMVLCMEFSRKDEKSAPETAAAEYWTETVPLTTDADEHSMVVIDENPVLQTVPLEQGYETVSSTVQTEPTAEVEREYLAHLKEYYDKNQDVVGWVEIEGTRLDYPLMYTPEEPEKYLHMDFNGNYSYGGLPFIDANCSLSPESDNLIIYGHNMLDGSMFRTLMKYDEKPFWEKHPVIRLELIDEEREYEILAAFYDRVYYTYETCFKFYKFIDAEDQTQFDEAMTYYKSKSLYDTGVTAQMGDRLITLVTCAYQVENGRFVIVAREKEGT